MSLSIINRQTAGILTLGGLLAISFFTLILMLPIEQILVMLLGLFIFVFFLYNPRGGLFLIILIRPTVDRFSENITIKIAQDISFNAAAILGILVVFLLSIFLLTNIKEMKSLPFRKAWTFFLFVALLSMVISVSLISSIYGMIKIISIFLIFSSAYLIVKKEKKVHFFLYAIIFSSIIPFLFATYQFITKTGLSGSEGIDSRLFGTFSHSNPFASFVIIVLAVSLYLLFTENRSNAKLWLSVLVVWGVIILEQTFARGAWFAFLIFLFIVTFKKSPKLLLLVIIFSLSLFIFSSDIQYRVQSIYNPPADSSVRWRFMQWERMYTAFLKKPITGYGIGTETIVHEEEYGYNAGNQYTHNDFLRVALETGIFGFIAYFLLLSTVLIKLLEYYIKQKKILSKDLGLFTLSLFIALVSYSLTNNNLNETVTQWTMWGLIGVSVASIQFSSKKLIEK
jgi:putative inorganic carbon (hco3(-)) transporter